MSSGPVQSLFFYRDLNLTPALTLEASKARMLSHSTCACELGNHLVHLALPKSLQHCLASSEPDMEVVTSYLNWLQ